MELYNLIIYGKCQCLICTLLEEILLFCKWAFFIMLSQNILSHCIVFKIKGPITWQISAQAEISCHFGGLRKFQPKSKLNLE